MIRLRFPNSDAEKRALGFLAGRFSFTSYRAKKGYETVVPSGALAALAYEGIPYSVEGRVTYEQIVPAVRGAVTSQVQRRKAGSKRTRRANAA